MRSKIKVTAPAQGDIEVIVYRSDGSTQAKAYTTETGTTLVTWPLTVNAGVATTMWVPVGAYVVSVETTDGVEFAGGYGATRAVWVDNDGVDLRPEPPVGAYGGVAGPGTGDLLSTNNLSDLDDVATAVENLGLDVVTEHIGIAVGDEVTALTTGTAKVTFRMPFAMTLTAVRANVNTVSSSGVVTVDINDEGTSILSTKLTIDANEKSSTTAATAAVISDTALADDAEVTIDIDTAGTGAKGLKVWIIGTRSV